MSVQDLRKEKFKKRLPPRRWNFRDMEFFEAEDEYELMRLAAGMDDEEVLAYYGVPDFDALPDYDAWFFTVCMLRGRAKAKSKAVENLFGVMADTSNNKATDAALAYLKTHSKSWQDDEAGFKDRREPMKLIIKE